MSALIHCLHRISIVSALIHCHHVVVCFRWRQPGHHQSESQSSLVSLQLPPDDAQNRLPHRPPQANHHPQEIKQHHHSGNAPGVYYVYIVCKVIQRSIEIQMLKLFRKHTDINGKLDEINFSIFFLSRERSGKYLFCYYYFFDRVSCYKQTDVLCKMCVKSRRFDFWTMNTQEKGS